jgi:hypothetical protein
VLGANDRFGSHADLDCLVSARSGHWRGYRVLRLVPALRFGPALLVALRRISDPSKA